VNSNYWGKYILEFKGSTVIPAEVIRAGRRKQFKFSGEFA
jgi:hypothetical protein